MNTRRLTQEDAKVYNVSNICSGFRKRNVIAIILLIFIQKDEDPIMYTV